MTSTVIKKKKIVPLHGFIGNRSWALLLCITVLFLGPAQIGGSVGKDGICDSVWGETLYTVLDMANRQLGLKKQVKLAV